VRNTVKKLINPSLSSSIFKSTVVVVGAGGELGLEFTRQLQSKDVNIIGVTRSNWTLLQNRTVALKNELSGCYVIIAVGSNSKSRVIDFESNVIATTTCVEFANFVEAKKLIHLSTGGLNGASEDEVLENDYLETKAMSEFIVHSECNRPFEIVRLFFPIGRNQRSIRLIPSIFASLTKGAPIRIRSDGGPFLTLTNRSEAVDFILTSMFSDGTCIPKVISVASGIDYSVVNIVRDLLTAIPGTEPSFEYDEDLKDCISPSTPGYKWSSVDLQGIGFALAGTKSIASKDQDISGEK
jgi:nucleoside-diphosphate-sugar epimerase